MEHNRRRDNGGLRLCGMAGCMRRQRRLHEPPTMPGVMLCCRCNGCGRYVTRGLECAI